MYFVFSIFFPILAGIYLLVRKEVKDRRNLLITVAGALAVTAVLVVLTFFQSGPGMFTLFNLTDRLPLLFKADEVSVIFSIMAVLVFL